MSEIKAFKKLMALMESNNRPNAKHKPMSAGMHAGTSAVGAHGLMPVSAIEKAKSIKDDNRAIELLRQATPEEAQLMLQANPELTERIVEEKLQDALNKSGGDPVEAAYRWRWGQNLKKDSAKKLMEERPEYKEKLDERIEQGRLQNEAPTFDIPELQALVDERSTIVPKPMSYINNPIKKGK